VTTVIGGRYEGFLRLRLTQNEMVLRRMFGPHPGSQRTLPTATDPGTILCENDGYFAPNAGAIVFNPPAMPAPEIDEENV